MPSRIFILALFIALAAAGCSSMKSPTYTADTLQKIRLHEGGTSHVLIVREDLDSLHAVPADENDTVAIPRADIASIAEFSRRRQMLTLDIGFDPHLSYYREVSRSFVLGASARYRSPIGLFGRYQFNTGPGDSLEAIELSGELRYHLLGGAMRGFYIAPSVGFAFIIRKLEPLPIDRWTRIGVRFGWQWFPGYSTGVGLSLGWNSLLFDDPGKKYRHFDGEYRLQVGYAW